MASNSKSKKLKDTLSGMSGLHYYFEDPAKHHIEMLPPPIVLNIGFKRKRPVGI